MIDKRKHFYIKIIKKVIINKNSKILVVGATKYDADIFRDNGYLNVTISNLEKKNNYSPYIHSYQDLRNLKFDNESYDYVVANACIHHTSKPHNAILEMYRVAKKGIIVIEGNDSNFIKIANYLNFSQEYELSAINENTDSYDRGGVDNTEVPNFVYRWTRREVYKLISSYEPQYKHSIYYYYDSDFEGYKSVRKLRYQKIILSILEIFAKLYFKIFSYEKNLFCFFINKEERKLQKWLKQVDTT